MKWVRRLMCRQHAMVLMSRQSYPTYGKVTVIERCSKCSWWRVKTSPL